MDKDLFKLQPAVNFKHALSHTYLWKAPVAGSFKQFWFHKLKYLRSAKVHNAFIVKQYFGVKLFYSLFN